MDWAVVIVIFRRISVWLPSDNFVVSCFVVRFRPQVQPSALHRISFVVLSTVMLIKFHHAAA